jgi:hypothetical protein
MFSLFFIRLTLREFLHWQRNIFCRISNSWEFHDKLKLEPFCHNLKQVSVNFPFQLSSTQLSSISCHGHSNTLSTTCPFEYNIDLCVCVCVCVCLTGVTVEIQRTKRESIPQSLDYTGNQTEFVYCRLLLLCYLLD